jgi:hypothetical protein
LPSLTIKKLVRFRITGSYLQSLKPNHSLSTSVDSDEKSDAIFFTCPEISCTKNSFHLAGVVA